MAVSASDIRSALSLPQTTSAPRKTHHASTKKPDGISRELYSLIGPSAPSLAAYLAKPRLKQKPNLGGGGTVKWYATPSIQHSPQTSSTGSTDHSPTAPVRMHCNSLTGSNSLTPLAVGHAHHRSCMPSHPSRLSLCKVQCTDKAIRLLSGRVHPSLGGSVLPVLPLPLPITVHRQRMDKGRNRLSVQHSTRI